MVSSVSLWAGPSCPASRAPGHVHMPGLSHKGEHSAVHRQTLMQQLLMGRPPPGQCPPRGHHEAQGQRDRRQPAFSEHQVTLQCPSTFTRRPHFTLGNNLLGRYYHPTFTDRETETCGRGTPKSHTVSNGAMSVISSNLAKGRLLSSPTPVLLVPVILIPPGLWPQRVLVHYVLRGSPAAHGKALSPQKFQPPGAKHHPEPAGNQTFPCTFVFFQLGSSSRLLGPPGSARCLLNRLGWWKLSLFMVTKGRRQRKETMTHGTMTCHWGWPDSCVSLSPSHQELTLPFFNPCPSLGALTALEGRTEDSSSPRWQQTRQPGYLWPFASRADC